MGMWIVVDAVLLRSITAPKIFVSPVIDRR